MKKMERVRERHEEDRRKKYMMIQCNNYHTHTHKKQYTKLY